MLEDFEKLFPYFDKLPSAFVLFRLDHDENGKVKDIIYRFANKTYLAWVKREKEDLIGKSFLKYTNEAEDEWLGICYQSAVLGKEQNFVRYSPEVKKWLNMFVFCPKENYCIVNAYDITVEKEYKEELTKKKTDDFVLKCIKHLHSKIDYNEAINLVLSELGNQLGADRVYILESKQKVFANTYEWCKEGITSEKENLQNIPYSIMRVWKNRLKKNDYIFLEDIYNLKDNSPSEYSLFSLQGIKRLLACPLYEGTHLLGYIGIDNFSEDKVFDSLKIIQSMAYFLSTYLQKKSLMKQLLQLSYHDSLTNALNRTAFAKYLRENDDFKNVGVIYIDINGLKLVNDTKGHSEGDFMISELYSLLTEVFSSQNIYRIGGDEFVVLENDIDENLFKSQITELYDKMKKRLSFSFALGHHYTKGKADVRETLRIADSNMYDDKKEFYMQSSLKSGRYRSHLDDRFGFTDSKVFQQLIENQQIIFYLQPKFSTRDFHLTGAEALVRYRRSNGEVVSAGEFISVLELTHSILELDYYIFRCVCMQIQEWLERGITPPRIAVNFSRFTLSQSDFIDQIRTIWQSCPVPKEYLEIEITETAIAENLDALKDTIIRLRAKGFVVSIDDFGSAQANFSTLGKIEFDYVKIDRSLVSTIVEYEKAAIILKGVIDICHNLGVLVVAEGIEKEDQIKALTRLKADELQGFYFSQAVSIDEFEKKFLKK